ncbi:MAG: hypothetical protein ACFE9L_04375 [Candidatus Hodarchaeota archaeon]
MPKKISWDEVRRYCKLDYETISKAKRLGISPRTVRANFSSTRQEKWKSSTKDWIDNLYERRYGKELQEKKTDKKV